MKWMRTIGLVAMVLGLGSCDLSHVEQATPDAALLLPLQTAAVGTFFADLTRQAPTQTTTPVPTMSPTASATATITATPQDTLTPVPVSELMKTYLAYYVTYPVESDVECKYYVIPFIAYPYVLRTGDYERDITNALNILFAIDEVSYGDFFNYLAPSDLLLEGYMRSASTLNVYFSGYLNIYGYEENCKDRQARDQIYRTIGQFDDMLAGEEIRIFDVVMWMDKDLLDDLLLHDLNLNTNP